MKINIDITNIMWLYQMSRGNITQQLPIYELSIVKEWGWMSLMGEHLAGECEFDILLAVTLINSIVNFSA